MNIQSYESGKEGEEKESVFIKKAFGEKRISLQEYLIGTCAATIPGEYEEETIKAQAVIQRSEYYAGVLKSSGEGTFQRELFLADGENYFDPEERKRLWGENSEEYEQKFQKAVMETESVAVLYQDQVIAPPYFRISNGTTRGSSSLENDGNVPWICSVSCEYDKMADGYLHESSYSKTLFFHILKEDGIEYPNDGSIFVYYDAFDYVNCVKIGDNTVDGERFRNLFHLLSSCFSVKEKDNEILITTRGVGHGIGFCQYAADRMAKNGADYVMLLHAFFQNIDIEKIV